MTSEVGILVDHLENVIQVPLQSIIEHNKGFYCITGEGKDASAKPVQLGPANEGFVVVEKGLSVGEVVAMNPYELESEIAFPPYPSDFRIKQTEPKPRMKAPESEKSKKRGDGEKITSLPKKEKLKKQRIQ